MPRFAEVTNAPDRVYYDESLQCYADEYLETVFRQIYCGDTAGEQGSAIAAMLDPYTRASFGESMVPFSGCLQSIEQAARWSMQFGDFRIVPVLPEHAAQLQQFNGSVGLKQETNFAVEMDRRGHGTIRVHGRTLHDAILLIGVQMLRESAYLLLNHDAEITAH
jgi:hypothetical protein